MSVLVDVKHELYIYIYTHYCVICIYKCTFVLLCNMYIQMYIYMKHLVDVKHDVICIYKCTKIYVFICIYRYMHM